MPTKKVSTADLTYGMYVVELDRPWLESSFMFQGFTIQTPEDLEALRRECHYVYIDLERGRGADRYLEESETVPSHDHVAAAAAGGGARVYRDQADIEEELPRAKEIKQEITDTVQGLMDDVRSGRKLDIAAVRESVGTMVESIIRNPDAYMWLTRLKEKDFYTYSHSVDASALAIAFGRHMGLPKEALYTIALGNLFCDIGKMRLPNELLHRPGPLTEEEVELVREHVAHSVAILDENKSATPEVRRIVETHHERFNGQGYPRGLTDEQTPVYGKMAAIVDCYDAITSERPYRDAMSSHQAIKKLYEWRNIDFQEELVEQFIQCLGVYPTGTLVELTTGEVAVVLSQNRVRRLRPKVMLVLDEDKRPYDAFPAVDLMTEQTDSKGRALDIIHALDEGAYGLDPKAFYL